MHAHHPVRRLLVALLVLVLSTVGALSAPHSALAAGIGPGYQEPGKPLNHLGGYLAPGGVVSYCIDAGKPSAVGAKTTGGELVDRIGGLDAADMVRLNVVLSRHGDTADDRTAAAVAMTVWGIAGRAAYLAEGGDAYVLRRAPAAERAAIQTLADRFRAEAAAYAPAVPVASVAVGIEPGDDYAGTVTFAATPTSVTGMLTLTNAVFVDTGGAQRGGVVSGTRLEIRATPPAGATRYRVAATTGALTTPGVPDANVRLFTTPGAQTLVASGSSTPSALSASGSDLRDRLVPLLSTAAQPEGEVGGTVSDTATVTHVPSTGLQLSWSGYLQPADATAPVCTAGTRVFESTVPLTVSRDGDYPSEAFVVGATGSVFWVETATIRGQIVAQGACGAPTEVSVLSAPPQPLPPHLPVVSG